MDFLELVLRLRQECSGKGTPPETVVDQTGMTKRFVDWTREAWTDIQSAQESWKWMRKDFSFAVTAGEADYPPFADSGVHAGIANFARWHNDTFRLYRTALGVDDEQYLVCFDDWQDFRNTYRFGVRQPATRPGSFGIRQHDDAILFDVEPEDAYTCVGEYQEEPTILTADDDTPAVEARFHMLIVYHAMIKYGIDQAAPEVIASAQAGITRLNPEFERRYLPRVQM